MEWNWKRHDSPWFSGRSCLTQTTIIHHVIFINDIVYNANQGFDIDDCGYNHNVPGNGGDYVTYLASIAQNAAQDSICLGQFDTAGQTNYDSNSGTHIYVFSNFAWSAANSGCTSQFDTEAIIFDTPDAHGYTSTLVAANNMTWNNARYGWQTNYGGYNTSTPTLKVYQNTFYNDLVNTGSDSTDGEVNLSGGGVAWVISITQNIGKTTTATSAGGKPIYAAIFGGNLWSALTVGGSGAQNVFKGQQSSCHATACDAGFNVGEYSGNTLGTNTYSDPSFTSESDLNSNWQGAPNCTGYATVTNCMGYNPLTSSLRSLTPISDLQSTYTASGDGYQLPSKTCATNADYPSYLKGLNRLSWNGSQFFVLNDLASKPCGL